MNQTSVRDELQAKHRSIQDELDGLTITGTNISEDKLYIGFDDGSWLVVSAINDSNGFAILDRKESPYWHIHDHFWELLDIGIASKEQERQVDLDLEAETNQRIEQERQKEIDAMRKMIDKYPTQALFMIHKERA